MCQKLREVEFLKKKKVTKMFLQRVNLKTSGRRSLFQSYKSESCESKVNKQTLSLKFVNLLMIPDDFMLFMVDKINVLFPIYILIYLDT